MKTCFKVCCYGIVDLGASIVRCPLSTNQRRVSGLVWTNKRAPVYFRLPLSHDYVETDHPASPHSPPPPPPLSELQLEEFRQEGVTVLRDVLPSNMVRLLQRAVRDLMVNNTLRCAMAAFNGPPILHR